MEKLTIFRNRMSRIGINLEFIGNYPWIYLDKVNGHKITEKFQANHGFCIGFQPIRPGQTFDFTDITEIFKIIRKYKNYDKFKSCS